MNLDNIVSEIGDFVDNEMTHITHEQRDIIYNHFNFMPSIDFAYAVEEDKVAFFMGRGSLGTFLYYTGLEYDTKSLVTRIEIEDKVLIEFEDVERANRIIELIDVD